MKKLSLIILLLFAFTLSAQKEDSLAVENGKLHYYTYGSGKPILVLSGGPGVSAKQEDDLALALSKKYQPVLLDQRGTGKSRITPMNEQTINLDLAIKDIERLREHLKIEKLTISGHSWGAMLACAYAQKYPQHVGALVLIGAGELSHDMSPIISEAIGFKRTHNDSIKYKHWSDPEIKKSNPQQAEKELRKLAWRCFTYDQKKIEKVLEQATRGTYNNEMGKLIWNDIKKQKFDFTKQTFSGPVLVVFGWQDPVGSLTALQYAKTFPNAAVEGIDECGHMPTVEQPEIFYRKVFEFLEKI